MDFGEMIVRAIRLLEEQPAARRRRRRALPGGARRRVPGHQLRPAASCCSCSSPTTATWSWSATTTSRSTASAAPRARTSSTSSRRFPDAKVIRLETNYRSQPGDPRRRPRGRRAERAPAAEEAARRPQPARAAASTPSRSGAARTSARRPRRWPSELERLIADGIDPADTAVLVRSVRNEGQLWRPRWRSAASRTGWWAARGFFERAEVRDLLAWLRLLSDPDDGRAVVRALMRPPVELGPGRPRPRARTIARRRKTDMVTALRAALESPDVPPEARERIETFLRLHRSARDGVRRDAPRPVRAPPDRAHRAAQAAPVQRPAPSRSSGS